MSKLVPSEEVIRQVRAMSPRTILSFSTGVDGRVIADRLGVVLPEAQVRYNPRREAGSEAGEVGEGVMDEDETKWRVNFELYPMWIVAGLGWSSELVLYEHRSLWWALFALGGLLIGLRVRKVRL